MQEDCGGGGARRRPLLLLLLKMRKSFLFGFLLLLVRGNSSLGRMEKNELLYSCVEWNCIREYVGERE